MTVFQAILILGIVVIAILAVRFLPGAKSLALKRILALLFAVAAILAILFPNALTSVANFFGIGRGADLLLYIFIIAGLLFAVATIRAKARSDARVTELARAVALMDARLSERTGEAQISTDNHKKTGKMHDNQNGHHWARHDGPPPRTRRARD